MRNFKSQCKRIQIVLLFSVAAVGVTAGRSQAQSTVSVTDGVYVCGNQLCSNGMPFMFQGVEIAGLVGPASVIPAEYVTAQEYFGQAELTAAKQFGANGIRFQLGQYGLDPQSTGYSADFVQFMIQGVNLALQNGFRVILTLQAHDADGGSTHDYGSPPLPDPDSLRVWQELAPIWKNDPRVMYELFNEPGVDTSSSNWDLAVNGGTFTKNAAPDNPDGIIIGFQQLINTIREAGATNVIIVPGLATEKELDGVIIPTDPLNNLAYGLHSPPLVGSTYDSSTLGTVTVTPAFWDLEFGFLTQTAPVITTEWVATSNFGYCVPEEGAAAGQLLDYFVNHNIGVDGWAFDLIDSLIQNWDYTPTNYAGDVPCGTNGAGPGLLLSTYYTTGFITSPAVLTVTANNASQAVGAATPGLTASYSGFVNGDTAAVLSGSPALSTTATTSSPAGLYPITVAQGTLSAANYTFAFVPGTLSVVQAPTVTITTSTTLAAVEGGYQATVTVTNSGTGPASDVSLTSGTLGTAAASPLPQSVATLGAGASAIFTVSFPSSAGTPGSGVPEKYAGTYTGGSFSASVRSETLP